jgi:hypothetical protein
MSACVSCRDLNVTTRKKSMQRHTRYMKRGAPPPSKRDHLTRKTNLPDANQFPKKLLYTHAVSLAAIAPIRRQYCPFNPFNCLLYVKALALLCQLTFAFWLGTSARGSASGDCDTRQNLAARDEQQPNNSKCSLVQNLLSGCTLHRADRIRFNPQAF